MYSYWTSWLFVKILLTAISVSGAYAFSQKFNSTDSEIQQRIIYVTPEDSCPVEHCFHLENILSNSSYFFDSYTTLELLPGEYNITEKVGQLVLVKVENFTFKGSSPNVTIICQPGVTFGLSIIQSHNIEISNIQISHCSAKILLEGNNNKILKTYNEEAARFLEYNLSSCDTKGDRFPACYTFLGCYENKQIIINQTAILHSKGVGIFSIDTNDLQISKTVLAYNQINCINHMWLDAVSTTFNTCISESQINFGQQHSHSFEFASGLNLFVYLVTKTHKIVLNNVTLANNRGTYGNFYMEVSGQSTRHSGMEINVNIQIINILSIQTTARGVSPGMVIKYRVKLENINKDKGNSINIFPPSIEFSECLLFHQPPFDSICYQLLRRMKQVNIILRNCTFTGSCVIIKDSELSIDSYPYYSGEFRFEMNNFTISESRCLTALSVDNSETGYSVQLSNLTIINSHSNILSVNNIPSSSSSRLVLTGSTYFLSNHGSVSLLNGAIEFADFLLISDNIAQKHESVFQVSDSSKVDFKGKITFVNNSGRQGGAISAYNSQLYFEGNVSFIGNLAAENGGAISLKEGAVMNLNNAHAMFIGNVADTYGGAIYVDDAAFWTRKRLKCSLNINNKESHYNVEFENNTAEIAGADLFGGWIDLCETEYDTKSSDYLNFKTDNSVGSHPTRVCICTNSTLNKHKAEAHIAVIPGQTFEIEAVAVGQRFGMIPASVRAESDVINQLQKIQDTENQCTKLKFTVRSSNRNETILLSIDGQIRPKWINESINIPDEFLQFKVLITLLECPLGFEFDNGQNICSCQAYLNSYGVQCNYTTYTVNRRAQQWIGTLDHTRIIVVHQHCPYDYCNPHALSLNLSVPDEQCSSYRSGILCGACQSGFSQVFGTSNCMKCSNVWILLMLIFALAGVLLVAGLVLFNLTVSMGTINGIIFYANIVRANTATFFPDKIANTFLSWFIAWLNLDVGIETCFYDGLDAYMKTWLQFVFPLYIWFLVTIIIISSKHSKRAVKIFGVNAVQVLATLFLLSYAKLLRVTIMVFQSTYVSDNHNVWYYDGNVTYLGKRHAPLMLVALLCFALFLLPYTLTIFGIQWLQMFSHYKAFVWVNKLKPLFDAYTGPYKDRYRYWTGLLLLVRIVLFIVFSTNTSGDPAINLLAIIIVIICLFVYLALFGGIYKIWLLNLLEYSSLLNLVILSVSMLYMISTKETTHTLSQVSVSITLCTTVLIIAYHGLAVFLKIMKIDPKVREFWRRNKKQPEITNQVQQCNAMVNPPVTYSVIELTEPLLEC